MIKHPRPKPNVGLHVFEVGGAMDGKKMWLDGVSP
jgi:hypothetical protein